MLPSQCLCVIFVLFLLLSHASSCTLFFDVVSSEQRRYLAFQQRGLPRAFVRPFYETFLCDIDKYVRDSYPKSDLSRICLTESDLTEFYGRVHDGPAIDREVAALQKKFPKIPYISQTHCRFMPNDARLERASQEYLDSTYEKLSEGDPKTAAALPSTSQVLYDPARQETLKVYEAHALNAPNMSALRLLRNVTGMVITLELAEVPRILSLQLLRHAVAWLSTMFRALQKDGSHVEVPVLFMPFYQDEFHRLQSHGRHKVPQVTEYDVEEGLGDELEAYCSVDAWGRLEILRWKEDGDMDEWTIAMKLFDSDFLAKMANRIGFDKFDARNYPPYDADLDGWETELAPAEYASLYDGYEKQSFTEVTQGTPPLTTKRTGVMESRMLNTKVRQTDMCIQPFYELFPRSGVTWEEECCASICCNSVLMMQISLSLSDCCEYCNQALCHIQHTQLAVLGVVHLQPYGCDDGGFVPVSL